MKTHLIPLLVTAAVLATLAFSSTSGQEPPTDLEERVTELEQWKAKAEARLEVLEKALGTEGKPAPVSPTESAERLLLVTITDKRWDPSDLDRDKYEDNIWWDAEYTAAGLAKPARSVKGVLKFCDLFGDARFQVRVTIDDPISPGGKLESKGVGIKYNQFLDTHKWLRTTELENMTFRFEVESVLYKDGTTERFGS